MKIQTSLIKDILPLLNIVKGNNELKPMTTMLGIKSTADKIIFYTMGRDKIKVPVAITGNTDFIADVAVRADLFLGLVDKTTTEEIEFTFDNSNIVFKGNGTYKIAKETGETGDIQFTDITADNLQNPLGILTKDIINEIIDKNSYALNPNIGVLSSENYHIKTDKVITSDTNVIAVGILKSGLSKDISLNPITLKALSAIGEDAVVYEVGTDYIIKAGDKIISSPIVVDASTFPADALLDQLTDDKFDKFVSVNKKAIIEALSRLDLFNIGNKPFNLKFTNKALEIYMEEEKEAIVYSNGTGTDFSFRVAGDNLKKSVSSINTDDITFKYKTDNIDLIRLDGNNVIEGVCSAD